ncbi:hypothetical protein Ciccas_011883 [Cichlidogyrus casuarinus]|uniref:Anoctamin n=1 Tax=Cichlidogyrus casuarinus TaxID=1844966 RepID=A0ABD2PPZ4_9PLAT
MDLEFCLFIDACKSKDKIHRHKHNQDFCTHLANILSKPDVNGYYLLTEKCCDGELESDHSKHYIICKVPQSMMNMCIDRIIRENSSDFAESFSSRFADSLTFGQRVQIADLSLAMLRISKEDLSSLVTGESLEIRESRIGEKGRYNEFSDQLFLRLKSLGLITSPVVRHNRDHRRNILSSFFGIISPLFALSGSSSTCSTPFFPPIKKVRDYLGDSVGAYFCWMQSYLLLLFFPASLGCFLCYAPRLVNCLFEEPVFLPFSESRASLRFFYSFAIIIWSFVCLKVWFRERETLTYEWSERSNAKYINYCAGTNLHTRAQFIGQWRVNPSTTEMEFYYPTNQKRLRYVFSGLATLLCFLLAALVNAVLLNLEGYIPEEDRFNIEWFGYWGRHWVNPQMQEQFPHYQWYVLGVGILHPKVIFIMNQIVFRCIAERLTQFENHKTDTEFETALVVKRFVFEAVDAYGCLFYLGLVQTNWQALQSMLTMMFLTDSARRITLECLIPYLSYKIGQLRESRSYTHHKKTDSPNKEETKRKVKKELHADAYDPFDDYLEMILQHGYIVLFAVANPSLIGLFAVVCNWIEMNSDMLKMLFVLQRPIPKAFPQCQSVWLFLLALQASVGVVSNLALMYSHSLIDQLDFIVLENALIVLAVFICFFFSNETASTRDLRRSRVIHQKRLLESHFTK